ncbi:VanZ family protein [Bacillus cereus]|uniref:VanZ family protein n=1 Tax=Bacillus cereus TaxID=1396 RepID=UPI0014440C28|nr:VanZ family protein [Bacillus cereus]NKW84131.1 VanZ family protein [Bacillus cereus]
MDILAIVQGLLPWIIKATIFLFLCICIYWIYQKRKGYPQKSKTISIFILILLLCWLIIVLGITTLSRAANYENSININIFSGYINAWNKWSLSEFQLIIFNILMFVPLGFLLPLYNDKFKKFIPTFLVSLGTTLGIECIQLITAMGIFELDDIFHNTLGAIIGFFLIIGILECVKEKKFILKSILKSIAIPMVICIGVFATFTVYSNKELGNMPILPAERQDMKHVTVESKLNFSEEPSSAAIYQNINANNIENGKKIATVLSNEYGLTQIGKIYTEGHNRIFSFKDKKDQIYELNYVLTDGTWTLTNFTPEEIEIAPDFEKTQKESIEKWMKVNKMLPNDFKYSLQDQELRWDVITPDSIKDYNQDFLTGLVMITPSKTKIPSTIFYSITENKFIKNVDIISPKRAYKEILNGNFEIYKALSKGDILNIKSVDISYIYDTKGYYQPVYNFDIQVNDNDHLIAIQIPAIK